MAENEEAVLAQLLALMESGELEASSLRSRRRRTAPAQSPSPLEQVWLPCTVTCECGHRYEGQAQRRKDWTDVYERLTYRAHICPACATVDAWLWHFFAMTLHPLQGETGAREGSDADGRA